MKIPEKLKPIETGLTIQEVREAVRRWEEKAGLETLELRRKTPGWSPDFDAGAMPLFPRRFPWE